MPINKTDILLQKYAIKRAERLPVKRSTEDEQLWSYRMAASVLHCFIPESLQPLEETFKEKDVRLFLYDDMVYLSGGIAGGLFTLKPEIRRDALKRFNDREEMQNALNANPDRNITTLQEMWESYLMNGKLPVPEKLTYNELANLSQITSWLQDIEKELPEQSYLATLLKKRSVMASFEHLVISNFTGRKEELLQLHDYIKSSIEKRKPILTIYGPGGIGKSALVGRMLWEHVQADTGMQIPFAYLAFDLPSLRIENPFTILLEAKAQFELQLPQFSEAFELFNRQVTGFRGDKMDLDKRKRAASKRQERIKEIQEIDRTLCVYFAELLRTMNKQIVNGVEVHSPVLITLDTFEEVQYRDKESLSGFWRMLEWVQEEFPPLRVIIAGRASVKELADNKENFNESYLAELNLADRMHLLENLGVKDRQVTEVVAKQIGGNPLSLRLAASVILSEGGEISSKGLIDFVPGNLPFGLDEQIIQGQLYKRVLDHIHNEDVRKLAHPGMALRVINPTVIYHLLAKECDVKIDSMETANALFEEMKRERALFEEDSSGGLRYRQEIRMVMLPWLQKDKYEEVKRLHQSAINYYRFQEGLEARAEEMYHRLILDDATYYDLDQFWVKGIETSIAMNMKEYSPRMLVWLASRVSVEVPREIFQKADIEDWERNITRKVKRALTDFNIDEALMLLKERDERSDTSPLFALEAKAYLLRDEYEKVEQTLNKGIAQLMKSDNRGRLAELIWLKSQIALLQGDPVKADENLKRAANVLQSASSTLALVQVLSHRLFLRETYLEKYPDKESEIRIRLGEACLRLKESEMYNAPFVIQLASSMLGDEFPEAKLYIEKFIMVLNKFPKEILTSENLRGLEEYRESWEQEDDNRYYESVS